MNLHKEIKVGFLIRGYLRKDLNLMKESINLFAKNYLKSDAKIVVTEKWRPFYSIFKITGNNFTEEIHFYIKDWISYVVEFEID